MSEPVAKRLPDEIIAPTARRRVVTTVFGTLLTVIFVNVAFLWYLHHTAHNLSYWMLGYKWELLRELPEPVDWLVLGDSSGNQAVDTAVLEAELGGRALNLCVGGRFTAVSDALMLDAYVRRHGPPRAAIIVHVYDIWPRVLALPLLARFPADAVREADLQPVCAAGWRNRLRLFLYRYVPLDSQNRTIGRILQGRATNLSVGRLTFRQGYMPLTTARPEQVEGDFRGHLDRLSAGEEFQISRDNADALARIVRLAAEHDFPVFLVNSPMYEGLWQAESFQAYFAGVSRFLNEAAAASPHVEYVLQRPITFPADQLQNVDHITATAAARYTSALAREIRTTQAGAAVATALSGPAADQPAQ